MPLLVVSENILSFVSGLGILQGLLLAILIYFHPRSDRRVNFFLALYILCLSFILCIPFMIQVLGWQKSFFIEPFPLLLGPFLYLYASSFKDNISWKRAFPHLFFFFIYFGIAYWYYHFLGNHVGNGYAFAREMMKHPAGIVFAVVKISWYFLYFFLTRRVLSRYQSSIRQLVSNTSHIDLGWANWLNNGTIILILITLGLNILMVLYPHHYNALLFTNVAMITPYLYIIAYRGVLQSTLWRQSGYGRQHIEKEIKEIENISIDDETQFAANQRKSSLREEKINEIVTGILAVMESEKLYQEPELNLQQLANRLSIPAHQLSIAINEGLQKTFYELVNGYRVEEAQRLLMHDRMKNYTILSIGFEAGFNSKTTFNTVFKKFTGLTPTEFRNRQLQTRFALA